MQVKSPTAWLSLHAQAAGAEVQRPTFKCGSMAQPSRMEICCTILMPVWRACQLFLLIHTALRKGSRAGMPRAEATTLNALAVVLRTYLHQHPCQPDKFGCSQYISSS